MSNQFIGHGSIEWNIHRDQQSQQSIFIHQNELIDQVIENDQVTFEIKNTPRGPIAVQVKKVFRNPTK